MNILICNVGSTSLKYQLFDMDRAETVLASGGAERVGGAKAYSTTKMPQPKIRSVQKLFFLRTKKRSVPC